VNLKKSVKDSWTLPYQEREKGELIVALPT
jgi:hypothetical protein